MKLSNERTWCLLSISLIKLEKWDTKQLYFIYQYVVSHYEKRNKKKNKK